MAADRVVDWSENRSRMPNGDQLLMLLEDYLGGSGKIAWEMNGFLSCTLIGAGSNAQRRWPGFNRMEYPEVRWFEVWPAEDSIDVITRVQDDFTRAVADGLVKLLVNACGGVLRG